MDARLWHQQATAPPRQLPTPIPVETFDAMSMQPRTSTGTS